MEGSARAVAPLAAAVLPRGVRAGGGDVEHTAAMRRAIELAARGLGATSPNPVVGAVVLDPAGQPAGAGWHAVAGGPHAEVVALAAAGPRARGGTVVVTLEPCAHTGRTAPCTEALLAAKVARVVYAVADPLHGGGAELLRSRGVAVTGGLLAAEAAAGNEAWLTAARTGRPFVVLKLAATLDGRAAAADRTARWITGPAARADAHRLRAESDAVLVGIGTVLADDPALTVRHVGGRDPLRVVLDTDGRTPATARVRPALILTAAEVKRDPTGRLDPAAVLALLHERGVRSVLVEGGPTVAGSVVGAGLVDKVVGYVAPVLLGAGPPALGDAGIGTLAAALRLRLTDVTQLGEDVRITGYPDREG